MGYIYILEFGGQHTDLIGNRLRDMGFPVKYAKSNAGISSIDDAAGFVISGGPKSVNEPDRYPHDPALFETSLPVLGICYGMQLLGKSLGASVHRKTREYGETRLHIPQRDEIFAGCDGEQIVWMNHGDSITPDGDFSVLGYTEKGVPAAIKSNRRSHYGVQFHPEVTHTEKGKTLLRNFARICDCESESRGSDEFDAGKFIDEATRRLREEVGCRTALIYTSGGVDSTVAAYLTKIAGVKMQPVYLEMGNGRKDEARKVSEMLGNLLGTDIHVHDRSQKFIDELYGINDPEQKRKMFVSLYAGTRQEIENLFGGNDHVLIQGTIATDRRETGKEAGKSSDKDKGTVAKIKTHHNVGAEDLWKGRTALPLSELTKDRVRIVARELGIPREMSERQPFPGPGLYVRFVTGYYEPERFIDEEVGNIAGEEGYRGFAIPRKGVGLKGDERAFEHAAFLSGKRDWSTVRRVSKQMIEELPVCRVLYFPHEYPFTPIHFWKDDGYDMNRGNLDRLRNLTDTVERTMEEYGVRASQTPVITFGSTAGWINVIRDVDSQDFRTLRPLRKPEEFPWECYDDITRRLEARMGKKAGITTFDVSDKPGGTTEWE